MFNQLFFRRDFTSLVGQHVRTVFTDKSGKIIWSSPALNQFLGYKEADLKNLPIKLLLGSKPINGDPVQVIKSNGETVQQHIKIGRVQGYIAATFF